MEEMEKTRNQSLFDYLECLQREYIIAELRKKIYTRSKDKKYWERVMDFKRKKIEDIASRNELDSIFTSDELKEEFRLEIYGTQGFPNFTYRNEDEREELEERDGLCYYSETSEVKIVNEKGETLIGHIAKDREDDFVEVTLRGDSEVTLFDKKIVTRIL